jgi:hypothetical protein
MMQDQLSDSWYIATRKILLRGQGVNIAKDEVWGGEDRHHINARIVENSFLKVAFCKAMMWSTAVQGCFQLQDGLIARSTSTGEEKVKPNIECR